MYVSRVPLLVWNYHSTAIIISKRAKGKQHYLVVVAYLHVSIFINWPGAVEDWKAETIEVTSVSYRA
jgi:hypothetical protein